MSYGSHHGVAGEVDFAAHKRLIAERDALALKLDDALRRLERAERLAEDVENVLAYVGNSPRSWAQHWHERAVEDLRLFRSDQDDSKGEKRG